MVEQNNTSHILKKSLIQIESIEFKLAKKMKTIGNVSFNLLLENKL